MSGLETAIRNALDRSNRADREIRARIYQSARQALDAGLRKQGVSDRLVIMQQNEMLERKIHEIEMEEARRASEPEPEPIAEPMVELDPEPRYPTRAMPVESQVEPPRALSRAPLVAPTPEIAVRGETRSGAPVAAAPVSAPAPEVVDDEMDAFSADRADYTEAPPRAKPAKPPKKDKAPRRRASASDTGLDVKPERAARPRKRRGFFSHLLTWVITLGVVGGGCWYFYKSGLVQSIVDEAMKAANQSGGNGQGGNFDPRRAFSDEWREIFVPARIAELKVGGQAKAEAVAASEGQAVRIQSAIPSEGGDVAIEVPVDVLREMAGKSSTVALTLQSGQNNSAQLSVRCDFGSLGSCSRHRFTATQEKLEAIFRVSFDRSLAPARPGRLIINSGIDGADRQVLLYSVRILPGQ